MPPVFSPVQTYPARLKNLKGFLSQVILIQEPEDNDTLCLKSLWFNILCFLMTILLSL